MPRTGKVINYWSQEERRYGFIQVFDESRTPTGESLFFHYEAGEFVVDGPNGPEFSGLPIDRSSGKPQRLNQPKRGDMIVFDRSRPGDGRPRAQPWTYQSLWLESERRIAANQRAALKQEGSDPYQPTQPITTTRDGMADTIRIAQPGDKLEVVFADKTFNGDLKGRLFFVISFVTRGELYLADMSLGNLLAVAHSGYWAGFRKYTFNVCDGFDAEYFIERTLRRELLESVQLIKIA